MQIILYNGTSGSFYAYGSSGSSVTSKTTSGNSQYTLTAGGGGSGGGSINIFVKSSLSISVIDEVYVGGGPARNW